ncbi:hypothetical protein FQA47_006299 [Oryzias melastigma]|uniref:Nucleotidyl transferase domain-containing protein n=1 Tax=Oryzias melastigma TaxID=30732 RepID=A0A834FQP9_ORYME|nr:hypothetical protein FQA47_006299 [Oryzias melastigma]
MSRYSAIRREAMKGALELWPAYSWQYITLKLRTTVIVVGGDTLFKEDFSLKEVQKRFADVQAGSEDSCVVLSYLCRDEETKKYGILEVDGALQVCCMKEKPLPSDTKSRRACPCFYVLSKNSLHLLDTFLKEKMEAPIEEKDAPWKFSYLGLF